jgi:ubiquinone biosynthesis protein
MPVWTLVRQARYLGRYREIATIFASHGFGLLVQQLGLGGMLSLPARVLRRRAPTDLNTAQRLRAALIALGPTAVKLGQILSTRPDLLPPEYLEELNGLQDTVPSFPYEQVVATIEAELGRPLGELFQSFDRDSLAAASLGQVHCAVLPGGEQVVVKVQRPDMATIVATDLAILNDLARLAQERTTLGQQYDLTDLAWEFAASLRAELDYRREGRNADRFRENFAGNGLIHIPTIYWSHTSARVLTSERLVGVKINDIAGLEDAGLDRKRLARHCMEVILKEIFVDGYFHGDPHAGNFFALPGEVVGAVDFGQVGVLDRTDTVQLLQLLRAITAHNLDDTLRALERLGVVERYEVSAGLRRDLKRFLDHVVDQPLATLSARDTGMELLALFRRHRLRLPAPLALLLKAMIMMEGTGLQLDPQLDIFGIARPYVAEHIAGTPLVLGQQALDEARDVAESLLALPHQAGAALRQVSEHGLKLQSSDLDMRRVAAALSQASGRLSLAMVLSAQVLGMAILALAAALGLGSTQFTVILIVGGVVLIVTTVWLLLSLIRR